MFEKSPLPTTEEMSQLFWLIFGTLNEEVQHELRKWWGSMGENAPTIETDPDRIQDDVVYILSLGDVIHFRVDRLADRKHSVLRIVYHELAHCYLAAVGRHRIDDYNKRRDNYESGATKLTKRFTDDLKRAPLLRKRMRSHALIDRLEAIYDFSPLYIGDKNYAQRIASSVSAAAGK